VGNIDNRTAIASNVKPIVQSHRPDRHTQIEHGPPTGPQPLPDSLDTERGVRATRPARRARSVQQPVTSVVSGQFQLDTSVSVGPQLLSDIAPNIVRLWQFAQSDRRAADRQPSGHIEKRHVRQVCKPQVRLFGRQPMEVRLLQRRLRVLELVDQSNQSASYNRQVLR